MRNSRKSTLCQIEIDLAQHELFGDWKRIVHRVLAKYRLGLSLLATRSELVQSFLSASMVADGGQARRVLLDPVVRITINRLLLLSGDGPDSHDPITQGELEEILADATLALSADISSLPEDDRSRYSAVDEQASWIWRETEPRNVSKLVFRKCFEYYTEYLYSVKSRLLNPDLETERSLVEGCKFLERVVPNIAPNIFPHVRVIALVSIPSTDEEESVERRVTRSLTITQIPGSFFLNKSEVRSVPKTAESILHESLHLKMLDLRVARAVLPPQHHAESVPQFSIPWRNSSVREVKESWTVDRSLAAFHVYVHLCLFWSILLNDVGKEYERSYPELGEIDVAAELEKDLFRAVYLAEQLASYSSTCLGKDGRMFLAWLGESLRKVEKASE